MTTPEQDPRAGWLAAVRQVLGAVEAHPALPLPYITSRRIDFYLPVPRAQNAPRVLAGAEDALSAALGVTFTPRPEPEDSWYVLEATMPGGLEVTLRAPADAVAGRRVTGTTVTDVTEWVRLPAEPDEGGAAE